MAFEHENQLVKHGAKGNFVDPLWDAAECKALRVALVAEETKRLAETADLEIEMEADLAAIR